MKHNFMHVIALVREGILLIVVVFEVLLSGFCFKDDGNLVFKGELE